MPGTPAGGDPARDRPAWANTGPLPTVGVTPDHLAAELVPAWSTHPVWEGATTSFRAPTLPPARRSRLLLVTVGSVTLALAVLALIIAVLPSGGTSPTTAGGPNVDSGQPGDSPVDGSVAPAAAGPTGSKRPIGSPTRPTTTISPGGPSAPTSAAGSPSPNASRSAPAAVVGGPLSAAYSVQNSWPGGFIAQVLLTNRGSAAQSWQVTIAYPATVTGYVSGWSNAPIPPSTVATAQGATITGGSPLPAGQSVAVFAQFNRQGDDIRPTQCSANGDACALG